MAEAEAAKERVLRTAAGLFRIWRGTPLQNTFKRWRDVTYLYATYANESDEGEEGEEAGGPRLEGARAAELQDQQTKLEGDAARIEYTRRYLQLRPVRALQHRERAPAMPTALGPPIAARTCTRR